jgi:hypothetical protein
MGKGCEVKGCEVKGCEVKGHEDDDEYERWLHYWPVAEVP